MNRILSAQSSLPGGLLKHDAYGMKMAFTAREGSKCCRARYGSYIVSAQGTPVATAYNGKPAGSKNDHVCYREGLPPNSKEKPNCCLHSEVNAIAFSDRRDRLGGTLYVSGVPCQDCSLVIMQSGLSRLVYYAGDSDQGHVGNSDDLFWQEYDVPIWRVAFTWEAWGQQFHLLGKKVRQHQDGTPVGPVYRVVDSIQNGLWSTPGYTLQLRNLETREEVTLLAGLVVEVP